MQRKAMKQLGKVTQWTQEKVFSSEKTQLSSDFLNFEKEVDVKRIGIERLHATSMPYFEEITRVKQSADPQASSKDKILLTEALGLVMVDHGGYLKGTFGDALSKYGRTKCNMAIAQEEFGNRLRENYIAGMERSMEAVTEYKTFRKKLDSRRLALDAAISKLNHAKKEKDQRGLEVEVDIARERFEEVEEETAARMEVIQGEEEQMFAELADLLDAELEYFSKCKELLEELHASWPAGSVAPSASRPRAKSNASSRSATRTRNRQSAPASSDDEGSGNRARSQSNASASSKGEKRRSMLPSFGSFGRKSGLSASTKPKRKERYGDEGRLPSEPEESEEDEVLSPRQQYALNGRARSTSTMGSGHQLVPADSPSYAASPPPMRRTHTSPSTYNANARYVKATYAYTASKSDELSLRPGMIIEVRSEASDDWWVGESEGRSGMFPAAYTEAHVPSPTAATLPPPMPKRTMPPQLGVSTRNLPPPSRSAPTSTLATQSHLPPSPTNDYHFTSDSEASLGYDDADHYTTASLAAAAGPAPSGSTPTPNRSRSSTITGKKAPPPPPPASRRSQSSTNIFGSSPHVGSPSGLAPPPSLGVGAVGRNRSNTGSAVRNFSLDSSPEGSPFMGSEDEEYFDRDRSPAGDRGGSEGAAGVTHGIGGLVLPRQQAESAPDCAECGCEDFTQNVFKPKGMCSTCYHQH